MSRPNVVFVLKGLEQRLRSAGKSSTPLRKRTVYECTSHTSGSRPSLLALVGSLFSDPVASRCRGDSPVHYVAHRDGQINKKTGPHSASRALRLIISAACVASKHVTQRRQTAAHSARQRNEQRRAGGEKAAATCASRVDARFHLSGTLHPVVSPSTRENQSY